MFCKSYRNLNSVHSPYISTRTAEADSVVGGSGEFTSESYLVNCLQELSANVLRRINLKNCLEELSRTAFLVDLEYFFLTNDIPGTLKNMHNLNNQFVFSYFINSSMHRNSYLH